MSDDDTKPDGLAIVEKPQPWDRLPEESDIAFAYFRQYRDRGPLARSLRKLSAELGLTSNYLRALSTQHQWQARVQAFDEWGAELELQEYINQREQMGRESARFAGQTLMAANESLQYGLETLKDFRNGTRFDSQGRPILPTLNQALDMLRLAAQVGKTANDVIASHDPNAKKGPGRPGGRYGDEDDDDDDGLGQGLDNLDLAMTFIALSMNVTPDEAKLLAEQTIEQRRAGLIDLDSEEVPVQPAPEPVDAVVVPEPVVVAEQPPAPPPPPPPPPPPEEPPPRTVM